MIPGCTYCFDHLNEDQSHKFTSPTSFIPRILREIFHQLGTHLGDPDSKCPVEGLSVPTNIAQGP